MKNNPLIRGIIEENAAGVGEISSEMIEARAKEIAIIAGHPMNKEDFSQALRELTGGSDIDAKQAMLESVSEDERWDPVPGSTGHQAPEMITDGEDDDGLSQTAQLYEEGVREAEHDQMLKAAKAAKNDKTYDE